MFNHVAFNLSYGYSIAKLSLYTKWCMVKGSTRFKTSGAMKNSRWLQTIIIVICKYYKIMGSTSFLLAPHSAEANRNFHVRTHLNTCQTVLTMSHPEGRDGVNKVKPMGCSCSLSKFWGNQYVIQGIIHLKSLHVKFCCFKKTGK